MWTQEGLSLSLCMYVYMYVLYNLVHLMPICNDLQLKYASFRYLHVYIFKVNGQFTLPAARSHWKFMRHIRADLKSK